jgi:hypothetical protein
VPLRALPLLLMMPLLTLWPPMPLLPLPLLLVCAAGHGQTA